MGFVRFDDKGRLIGRSGAPVHIVGINYVAGYVCTNFWEDWRPDRIDKDLERIASLGLEAVRVPMHWEYMEPAEGVYREEFERRFREFVGLCKKHGLYVMPWFLVGVATRDYDVSWRGERSFFCPEMTVAAQNHLRHFISPYSDEENILFWDICDEPEWYSRHPGADQLPYDREKIAAWVKAMYSAIKSVDGNHLVTLGFGHIANGGYGMDLRDMSDILDLMVVTAYPPVNGEAIDLYRNNYALPYHVKMNTRGKPVFTCESPGYSSVEFSEEIIGRFYKTSIYSNLIAGSTGVLPWVYNDFERGIWNEKPLDRYLIEPGFGIVTADGRLKPCGKELAGYAAFVKKHDIGSCRPKKTQTAILLPDAYHKTVGSAYPPLYNAFLYMKGCGLNPDFAWSSDDLSSYKLIAVAEDIGMTSPEWDKLRGYVESGGRLLYCFGSGANAYFAELFGVENQTPVRDAGIEGMTVCRGFGKYTAGDKIKRTGAAQQAYTKVRAVSAETLCVFHDGSPALLKNGYGKGEAYLLTMSVFDNAVNIPYEDFIKSDYFDMLGAVADCAGIARTVRSDDPRIETGHMVNTESGEEFVICVNHDASPVNAVLSWDAGVKIIDEALGTEYPVTGLEVSFEPAGVRMYRLSK